ncbi:MAG: hypothetical protein R2940_09020 [Syntrophotaleaceae bacterium]
MKKFGGLLLVLAFFGLLVATPAKAAPEEAQLAAAVQSYFAGMFEKLETAAAQNPTTESFRSVMKPLVEDIEGFYGSTLIDNDFVIRQVYKKRNFLAVGYDLKKVEQLDYFWDQMRKKPAPQLSEPGHGTILQPRLIAMRHPILQQGRLTGVVSLMVRTEAFLAATGLDQAQAYRIVCRGEEAETEGDLGKSFREVRLMLPSTEWLIQYR